MNINEQLRILREGIITSNDLEFNNELIESWFIDSNEFLSESTISKSSICDLVLEMAMVIEAGTADPKETLGIMAKLKSKLQQLKIKFDPYEGLRELKLIQSIIPNDTVSGISNIVFAQIISAPLYIFSFMKKYKNMDPSILKQYLSEAEKFKVTLNKRIAQATKNNDTNSVKKLNRILKKLDSHIITFKQELRMFAGHKL